MTMMLRNGSENDFGLRFILRALYYRNYRLFFIGQSVSLIGSWMQMIAVSWLTYRLTDSVFLLGAVAFINQLPIFIFSPFAGVLSDRWNRRNILVVTQVLAMLQAFALAFLSFTHTMTLLYIMGLSLLIGLVNAFDMPVRQAFVVDMVEDRKDMGNAIALNSFIFNAARLVGSSIAGILIAALGEGMCFLINGVSFLAVIFALFAMKMDPKGARQNYKHFLQELKDGVIYAFNHAGIRYILFIIVLVSLIGMPYVILIPVFVKEVLSGGAHTFGFLMGATGLGALLGAAYLAAIKTAQGLERTILRAAIVFGAGLAAFSFSTHLWLSLILMFFTGFGMIALVVSCNTLLQNMTDDDKRGRVMSFYTTAFIGTAPFGSLLAGSMAGKFGAPFTLMVSGFICAAGTIFFARKIVLDRRA